MWQRVHAEVNVLWLVLRRSINLRYTWQRTSASTRSCSCRLTATWPCCGALLISVVVSLGLEKDGLAYNTAANTGKARGGTVYNTTTWPWYIQFGHWHCALSVMRWSLLWRRLSSSAFWTRPLCPTTVCCSTTTVERIASRASTCVCLLMTVTTGSPSVLPYFLYFSSSLLIRLCSFCLSTSCCQHSLTYFFCFQPQVIHLLP